MSALAILLPLAAITGLCWLFALLRAVSGGQFEDPEGAALRIFDEDEEASGTVIASVVGSGKEPR